MAVKKILLASICLALATVGLTKAGQFSQPRGEFFGLPSGAGVQFLLPPRRAVYRPNESHIESVQIVNRGGVLTIFHLGPTGISLTTYELRDFLDAFEGQRESGLEGKPDSGFRFSAQAIQVKPASGPQKTLPLAVHFALPEGKDLANTSQIACSAFQGEVQFAPRQGWEVLGLTKVHPTEPPQPLGVTPGSVGGE